jgi:hypothetical protein
LSRAEDFILPDWEPSSQGTFPETATIIPGVPLTGDIRWYAEPTARPPGKTVTVAVASGPDHTTAATLEVPMVFCAIPPAPESAPRAPLWKVPVAIAATGATFFDDGGDAAVRIAITVENPSTAPLELPRGYIQLHYRSLQGELGSFYENHPLARLPAVTHIPAGGKVALDVTAYWRNDHALATLAVVTFGPTGQVMARADVALEQPQG